MSVRNFRERFVMSLQLWRVVRHLRAGFGMPYRSLTGEKVNYRQLGAR